MDIDHRDPHTSVRASPGKGLGLFARKDTRKGTVVARMRLMRTVRPSQWVHVRLPHDAAIVRSTGLNTDAHPPPPLPPGPGAKLSACPFCKHRMVHLA